jgi:hypothetical protein
MECYTKIKHVGFSKTRKGKIALSANVVTKDLIEISDQYHADTSLDWRLVTELAKACPWGDVYDESAHRAAQAQLEKIFNGNWFDAHAIATAESVVGKPLSKLRTQKEIDAALNATSGNDRPALLFAFWRRQRLKTQHLRRILLDVWRYTDFPCRPWCPASAWLAMFQKTGFLSDGTPRPKRTTLYRGCTPIGRRGMSWSTELWSAEKFADHWYDRNQAKRPGNVYKARVRPRHILAVMPEKKVLATKLKIRPDGSFKQGPTEFEEVARRPEHEVIINPTGLKEITLVETAKVRHARLKREELLS